MVLIAQVALVAKVVAVAPVVVVTRGVAVARMVVEAQEVVIARTQVTLVRIPLRASSSTFLFIPLGDNLKIVLCKWITPKYLPHEGKKIPDRINLNCTLLVRVFV